MTRAEQRRAFAATPASAGEARRFVESALADAGLEDLAYTATMLVSELVANAILHTGTPLEVVVAEGGDHVRIEVHDGSRQLPVRKNYSNMSGTGRGLMMVERLSTAWGAEAVPAGKVVWFQLDTSSAPTFDLLEVEAL
jgi:anti-sigma regulatory factor (Ser/Thr protein kinase)